MKNDIKGTWKTINGILNKTKRKKTFPKIFKENGMIYTNKTDIRNKFNKHFTDIGPELSNYIQSPLNKSYKTCLNKTYNTLLKFQNVDEERIADIIHKFIPQK